MLAITPIWAGAVALYNIAFHSRADVQIEPLVCEGTTVKLAIANEGGKAGILGDSSIEFLVDGNSVGPPMSLVPAEERPVIRPEDSFVLNFEPRVAEVATGLPVAVAGSSCEYRVHAIVRDFEGNTEQRTAACPCLISGREHESG